MEREKKKRRRAEKTEARKDDAQMNIEAREPVEAEEVAAAEAEASPPPTEEEVEEFFAILRRMRVAVKYFEKEGYNSKSGGNEPQINSIAEEEAEAEGGGERAAVRGGLDLNTVPEVESSLV